jgi:hypothetical protein
MGPTRGDAAKLCRYPRSGPAGGIARTSLTSNIDRPKRPAERKGPENFGPRSRRPSLAASTVGPCSSGIFPPSRERHARRLLPEAPLPAGGTAPTLFP